MLHLLPDDEQIARQAKLIYERDIRGNLHAEDDGKVLVIDVETGTYEIDRDHLTAVKRARIKRPDAVLFAMRIGFPALARLGGRSTARCP